ncbi:CheY-like chemotaxis protein [Hypnocyclicus thermotrophus]|uniref:CheY-like chemotaxis protein n=1 Tax=Hypnocyclicus thermotrophus TaxID=1627895 RepID=A0AA46E080_9FUSO|nr:response regulator [Hypnocyclicus thermotrophus]TDT72395.1 CheY-like chemotaxis protein [Hypnocyclicus thermotrophus]
MYILLFLLVPTFSYAKNNLYDFYTNLNNFILLNFIIFIITIYFIIKYINIKKKLNIIHIRKVLEEIIFLMKYSIYDNNTKIIFDICKETPKIIKTNKNHLKLTLVSILDEIVKKDSYKNIIIKNAISENYMHIYIYDLKKKIIKEEFSEFLRKNKHIKFTYLSPSQIAFSFKIKIFPMTKFDRKELSLNIAIAEKDFFLLKYYKQFFSNLDINYTNIYDVANLFNFLSEKQFIQKYDYFLISEDFIDLSSEMIFPKLLNNFILKEKSIFLIYNPNNIITLKKYNLNYIFLNPISQNILYNELKLYHKRSLENKEERKKKNILLVESNNINSEVTKEYFTLMGIKCTAVKTGKEALNLLLDEQFSLIFLDIQLNDINGFDLAKAIRKNDKLTPIIAVTIHLFHGYENQYFEAGIDDYVAKPIIYEELQKVTFKYLNNINIDIDNLKMHYGDKIFKILSKNFLNNIKKELEDFEKNIEDNNIEEIKKILKNISASIGNFKMNKTNRLINYILLNELETNEIYTYASIIKADIYELTKKLKTLNY